MIRTKVAQSKEQMGKRQPRAKAARTQPLNANAAFHGLTLAR